MVAEIGAILDAEEAPLTSDERQRLVREIARDVMGLGPIEPFLADSTVTEVMVNGTDYIYVERDGVIEQTEVRFISEEHLRRVIDRIVAQIGRRIDESVADGGRPPASTAPVSTSSSRRCRWTARSSPSGSSPRTRSRPTDLVEMGTMTRAGGGGAGSLVEGGLNILVSGGTGTGKTTMLNVLSSFVPRDERIVTIEDAVELQLHQDHVIRLEARPANIEGAGRDHHPGPGPQRPAHAARPHHRR